MYDPRLIVAIRMWDVPASQVIYPSLYCVLSVGVMATYIMTSLANYTGIATARHFLDAAVGPLKGHLHPHILDN